MTLHLGSQAGLASTYICLFGHGQPRARSKKAHRRRTTSSPRSSSVRHSSPTSSEGTPPAQATGALQVPPSARCRCSSERPITYLTRSLPDVGGAYSYNALMAD